MNKRRFQKVLLGGGVGFSFAALFSGCKSRISETAHNKDEGDPYICGRCGYVTRSKTDMSEERCPRCYAQQFSRISEANMASQLEK